MRLISFAIFVVLALLILYGCTDRETAERVLKEGGYTQIQLRGFAWWGCGKDDDFATRFEAINPAGNRVSGVVCSGIWKGATVRFD